MKLGNFNIIGQIKRYRQDIYTNYGKRLYFTIISKKYLENQQG